MNREIKFRAWDRKNEEWLFESNPELLTWYGFHILGECTEFAKPKLDHWKYLEFQQYTGLKDKNGTEIYEGDHWKYSDGSIETICDIIFEDGRWKAVRKEDGADMIGYYEFEILTDGEVVGNCYEN